MLDKFAFIKKFFEQDLPFDRYLGLCVEEVREGHALCRLPFRPEFIGDPFRSVLHGGIISTLIDVTAGVAALSTLPLGSRCSTVDLRVDYLRPGGPRDLFARAEILRSGSSVAVIEITVYQLGNEEPSGGIPVNEVARGRAAYSLKPQFADSEEIAQLAQEMTQPSPPGEGPRNPPDGGGRSPFP